MSTEPQQPPFNTYMSWVFQILAIAQIVAQIVKPLVESGQTPQAADVKQQTAVALQAKIDSGLLHPMLMDNADLIIDAAVQAHPDVKLASET